MNKKQEDFILYCLIKALSAHAPEKEYDIKTYVLNTFNKLGDE